MQDLYTENYKILLKEDLHKWIVIPYSWIERQYSKDVDSLQIDQQIQGRPCQNYNMTFVQPDKLILKLIWKCRVKNRED